MDFSEMIREKLNNPATLDKLARQVDATPEQAQQVAALGLPALLGGMTDNSRDPMGAEALAGALDEHQNDPVDDVDDYLDHVDREDGDKIVNHLLGGEKAHVQDSLARRTGLQGGQVAGLLAMLAPLLLGMLGRQKRSAGVNAGGLPGLLSQLAGMLGLGFGGGTDSSLDRDMVSGRNVGDIGRGATGSGSAKGGSLLGGLLSKLDADQDGDFMDDINTMFDKFRNR